MLNTESGLNTAQECPSGGAGYESLDWRFLMGVCCLNMSASVWVVFRAVSYSSYRSVDAVRSQSYQRTDRFCCSLCLTLIACLDSV